MKVTRRADLRTIVSFVFAYALLGVATLQPGWFGLPFDLTRVVWIPSGLGVAMILRYGGRFAIWIFLAEVITTLATGDGVPFALGAGLGNAMEAWVALVLLDRLDFDRTLSSGRDVVALVGVAAGLAALVGAVISVTSLVLFEPGVPASSWPRITVLWWLTHANGMLLATPVLLAIWHGSFSRVRERSLEAVLLAVAVLVLGTLLFDPTTNGQMGRMLLYVPFPLLLWSAFRFRLPGAATANLLLALPAMLATSIPAGPFAISNAGSGNDALIQLWIFVAVNAVTVLFVAAVVEEREREVEARLAAEAERRELADRMHQAQRAESLGVLAGGIAHDFNNLLVSIMGNADLAERKLGDDHPAGASVTEILRASQRAAEICRQMLAYAGRGRVSNWVVDLSEVAAEMTELLAVSFGPKTELEVDVAEGLRPVWGDVTQLRRVVLNLLTNALDALPEGRGRISVSTGSLRLADVDRRMVVAGELPAKGPLVHLTVADDGEGMRPELRDRIFEPFFTTKDMGRGLGLAAVIGIVRAHGGVLELRTAPGEGSRFRVILPVTDRTEENDGSQPFWMLGDPAEPVRFRGSVLLVDDEEGVREVASAMLRETGAQVIEAVDGVEAVERFRTADQPVAVVLLDVMMPRMDGFETLEELRKIDPDVRVVLTTGNVESSTEIEEEWDVQVLQKPYRTAELLAVLRKAVDAESPG